MEPDDVRGKEILYARGAAAVAVQRVAAEAAACVAYRSACAVQSMDMMVAVVVVVVVE